MKNGSTLIGLFQGMFENNILTFNPGWDEDARPVNDFDDVRSIHQSISESGIQSMQENLKGDRGPGSFVVVGPVGNPIFIDQHLG